MKKVLYFLMFLLFSSSVLVAQEFSVDAYKKFLQENKDMSTDDFYNMYPPGKFLEKLNIPSDIKYLKEIADSMNLTSDEIMLIRKHGFMVTSRVEYNEFVDGLHDIFIKDLPIFVSSDMILHPIHKSYDLLLSSIEKQYITVEIDEILEKMHDELPALYQKYQDNKKMLVSLNDVDVYLTVARSLINKLSTADAYNAENQPQVIEILDMIENEMPVDYKLFKEASEVIDFSQYQVRGHYEKLEMDEYFKTMMWLGRVQFYFLNPQNTAGNYNDDDTKRSINDAYFLKELTERSNTLQRIERIDDLLEFLVGESDNIQFKHLDEILSDAGILNIKEILDKDKFKKFTETVSSNNYSEQKILSQILYSYPMDPEQVVLPSSFRFMGQRFIIDSYVLANVVYDRIIYKGSTIRRMIPSTLDVLFALGNDPASDFLNHELEKYNYSTNLAV